MTTHFKKFGVIGGGAWGTAIAQMLTREGQDVLIWCREPDVAEAINTHPDAKVLAFVHAETSCESEAADRSDRPRAGKTLAVRRLRSGKQKVNCARVG